MPDHQVGQLVEQEPDRRAASPVAEVTAEAPPRDQAIAALTAVRQSIDDIAGRLARSAVTHGASWSDVASSLRLREQQARKAYAADPGRTR